jgi:hypothetical protein
MQTASWGIGMRLDCTLPLYALTVCFTLFTNGSLHSILFHYDALYSIVFFNLIQLHVQRSLVDAVDDARLVLLLAQQTRFAGE